MNNLIYHLNELEKEQPRPKDSRRKEKIKIREEIHKIEIKQIIQKINKIKSCCFLEINKIDKPLARLTKRKREDPNKQNKK